MNKDSQVVQILLNGLIGIFIGALLTGLLGLAVAGWTGFLNGAILGSVFGLIAGLGMASTAKSLGIINRVFGYFWRTEHEEPPE